MAFTNSPAWSKFEYTAEVDRLSALVRSQNATIANQRKEIEQLKPEISGPSVLTPAQELVHLRKERERLTKIARDRAIKIRDMQRKLDAIPALADVFDVGSPIFHAVWTALQQFVDNQDDSEEGERVGAAEVELVKRVVDDMDAAFAIRTEEIAAGG